IEVMGLAVLPARLKDEMKKLGEFIVTGKDIRSDGELEKHADWAEEFKSQYDNIDENNVDEILKKEIGIVFKKVLEHAGVFKNDDKGAAAFMKFIDAI
ncbi:MAG TPA: galactose-1-phosphate uridylyltransferase, partial [Lachnospiraceae bacterium]|nr:galactose-1-phosphate uridylyltransferase [Lachnospiraceae bacterium]